MIRIIRWLLTASIRYSYRFVRTIIRFPLLLLPISERLRNQVAGGLTISLWLFGVWVVIVAAGTPWWGHMIVAVVAAALLTGVIRMEGRRAPVRR